MRFRYAALTGLLLLALLSALFLPAIFSHLSTAPEVDYYRRHPDLTYSLFSNCKRYVDDAGRCYAAYTAAVSLADSADCSPQGRETKFRFKRLVEHASKSSLAEEIASDCAASRNPSSAVRWLNKLE